MYHRPTRVNANGPPVVVVIRDDEIWRQHEQLAQILAWIAKNPDQGDDSAIDQMDPLGLQMGKPNVEEVRLRIAVFRSALLNAGTRSRIGLTLRGVSGRVRPGIGGQGCFCRSRIDPAMTGRAWPA